MEEMKLSHIPLGEPIVIVNGIYVDCVYNPDENKIYFNSPEDIISSDAVREVKRIIEEIK